MTHRLSGASSIAGSGKTKFRYFPHVPLASIVPDP